MGNFNRSKAKAAVRSKLLKIKNFKKEVEALKRRSSLSYKSAYSVIAEDFTIKVLYNNKPIYSLRIEEYHSYGDFFWCKPKESIKWHLYQKGMRVLEFDYMHRFFFEKENAAHMTKTIYHITANDCVQMFACISFFSYSCLTSVFYLKHNTWQIAEPNWRGSGISFLSLKKGLIKVLIDRQKKGLSIETKEEYYLSKGDGLFERLDKPTPRMKFCAKHNKPYYTGVDRLFSLGTELSFFLSKKHPN